MGKVMTMKKIFAVALVLPIFVLSCGKPAIDDATYSVVYSDFTKKAIVKGLDHRLSSAEKHEILKQVSSDYKVDYSAFLAYLKEKHADDFKYISE